MFDYKTIKEKDIFLAKLQGESIEFESVDREEDLYAFLSTCIKLKFIEFTYQGEHRGILARFNVKEAFMAKIHTRRPVNGFHPRTLFLLPGDQLEISELFLGHDFIDKKQRANGAGTYVIHLDVPLDERKPKMYKDYNFEN